MGALKITAIVLGALAVGFLIIHVFLLEHLFRRFFCKTNEKKLEHDPFLAKYHDTSREAILRARAELEQLPHREVSVLASDGVELVANYYDFGKKNTVIFMHGFHSHPFNTFSELALGLIGKGYNILFPYERAHGKSGGAHITYGWKEQYDLLKWIEYIDAETPVENILIYGVSMGGTAVGLASDKIDCDKVKALIIDCAYIGIGTLLSDVVKTLHLPGKLFVPGIKRRLKRRMGMSLDQFDVSQSVRGDRFPTLFVYGEKDAVVSRESFMKIYDSCPSEKEMLSSPNAGHAVAIIDGGAETREGFYRFINKYVY